MTVTAVVLDQRPFHLSISMLPGPCSVSGLPHGSRQEAIVDRPVPFIARCKKRRQCARG